MEDLNDKTVWFEQARALPAPKFITGLRGIGKTHFLRQIQEQLLADGVPAANVLYLDTEDPSLRRYSTHTQILDHILSSLPRQGKSYILIREAAALPSPEIVVGTLVATSRFELYATSSSQRLLGQGLRDYFAGQILHFNMLPAERRKPYPPLEARLRWNEIFLYDVLAPNRILELPIINRLTGWLSDNLGDALSLRQISGAISPAARILSPHTIDSYLSSLEDAHLVEKVLRWDTAEESPQKTGYRYFFKDPWLRLAHFGPAPEDEDRRMALNRAWLHLRRSEGEVFVASGTPDADFITRTASGKTVQWSVDPSGSPHEV